jgi:hypothetical protein
LTAPSTTKRKRKNNPKVEKKLQLAYHSTPTQSINPIPPQKTLLIEIAHRACLVPA